MNAHPDIQAMTPQQRYQRLMADAKQCNKAAGLGHQPGNSVNQQKRLERLDQIRATVLSKMADKGQFRMHQVRDYTGFSEYQCRQAVAALVDSGMIRALKQPFYEVA